MKTLKRKNTGKVKQELLRHLPQCIEIAERCLEPYWGKEFLERHIRKGSGFMLSKANDTPERKVAGYMIYNMEADAICLTSIAVHPDHQRKGIALYMVDQLLDIAEEHRLPVYTCIPRESRPIQVLLRSMAFSAIDTLSGGMDGVEKQYVVFRYLPCRRAIQLATIR